jgi:glycosyltransferase involved in cell wall biosynthesis
MRLLWFNLATDEDDPLLGFAPSWIRAVARRIEAVEVITLRRGRFSPPDNVRVSSVGRERGHGRLRCSLEFYRLLLDVMRWRRVDGCFSHMMPLFTAMAAPALRAARVPAVTWYTHRSLTFTIRAAHWASRRMVTCLPTSYPYRKDKLVATGHGIDTGLFSPDGTPEGAEPTVLYVGRVSPIKNLETLVRAAGLLARDGRRRMAVRLVGDPVGDEGREYLRALRGRAAELGVDEGVTFEPTVPHRALAAAYRSCWVHVNLTGVGSGDKAVLEAMSCGRPCLVANPGFRATLGRYADELSFREGDERSLADRLDWILSLRPEERAGIGHYLRGRVQELHGLERLADRLVGLFEELSGGRRARAAGEALAP